MRGQEEREGRKTGKIGREEKEENLHTRSARLS